MNIWKEYKLDDIVEIIKESYFPTGSDDLKYIGLEHIEQETLKLISIGSSKEVSSNKYIFKANDVLFGKLRPYFRKVVKTDFDGICSTDIWVFRAKKGFDQNFIFYFLANWDFVNLANSGESGTRMPRADWGFLKETIWKLPPLNRQIEIAEILSSLDDKIDLLNRQNKTLERLAEIIFKQWFVEAANENWNLGVLKNYVKIIDNRGKTPPNSEMWTNYPLIEANALNDEGRLINYSVVRKYVAEEIFNNWFRDKLNKYDTIITTVGANIGSISMYILEKGNIAQNIIGLSAEGVSPFYLYQILKFKKSEIIQMDIGGVQPSIKVPHLLSLNIPIPDKKCQKMFDVLLNKFIGKMENNYCQIQTLTLVRNTLIPKLIGSES